MRLHVWYKNPRYPRLQYSNETLPSISKSAYGIKHNFEGYFRKEASEKWNRKTLLQKVRTQLEFYTGKTHFEKLSMCFSFKILG